MSRKGENTYIPRDYKFSHEEHEEIYEVFCKHQGHLYNQGIMLCQAGHDPSKCDTCEFREPDKQVCKVSSCTIEKA